MCGSVNNRVFRQDGPASGTSRKAHLFFDCRAKVLDQMKPIGYLPGLRCAFTDGLRIETTAVPADDLDGRVVTQPLGRTLDAAIVQYVDNRATLEINHDGPIVCRTPPTPVIDANHPDLRIAVSNGRIPLQLPQDGVVADRHAEPLHQAFARTAARAVAQQSDNLNNPRRPARIRSSGLPWTGRSWRLRLDQPCRFRLCRRQSGQMPIADPAAETTQPSSTVSATPSILTPGPGDHFVFVRMPANSDPSLMANEPHKVRKNPKSGDRPKS